MYAFLADLVLLAHFGFLLFVVLGGFHVLKRPRVAWLHVPLALWGIYVEFSGAICPLTPLENDFRTRAGDSGYSGGFIDHYITALIYPAGLTRNVQIALGAAVLAGNALIYARLIRSLLGHNLTHRGKDD